MTGRPLLTVDDLVVDLGRRRSATRVVDGVSLTVAAGETVGLVGESGSGKSTIARAILGLTPVTDGRIGVDGVDVTHAGRRQRRALSHDVQLVFQDPFSSLNPARRIGDCLVEPLLNRRGLDPARRRALVVEALLRVGLPAEAAHRYPGQFSGGQRQRIALARALVGTPRLLVTDEPVSALDLSVRAQIINLLADLQADLGFGHLFIAHDLAVVRHLSHRIVVLYRGQVVESGPADAVYRRPAHPYTRALLAAAPVPDPGPARAALAAAGRQQPAGLTSDAGVGGDGGCRFAARCPYRIDACTRQRPPLAPTATGALSACLRHADLASAAHPAPAAPAGVSPPP
ncbi:oligopeptide/dipeptide ABC transporter ATP-binding protein [Micromonospora humidisoli]|uniref:ABC transporter ATP-binding protein n=1 Tax=Micromonospora humidisoli TaxID=2807622 RepID=A0ABS2JFI6_9ACTN|nr:oligopeptide/dipeptide ABC transporter ATP-binding protein [Micromonospora humidisoli]MBM7085258.1 ABC transporter ATP-binding protein [Micromonospora humidisoli]